MSFFKTPTPEYKGHHSPPATQPTDWLAWIRQLFTTPTPQYLRTPVAVSKQHKQDR